MLTVKRYAELFNVYFGIGQLVHPLANDSICYKHTRQLAQRYGTLAEIEEIEGVGYPPYSLEAVTHQRKWLTKFYEIFMKEKFNRDRPDYRKILLSTPEYTLWDVIMMGIDPLYSSRHL